MLLLYHLDVPKSTTNIHLRRTFVFKTNTDRFADCFLGILPNNKMPSPKRRGQIEISYWAKVLLVEKIAMMACFAIMWS